MRPTTSLVRAALGASLLSTLPPVLGVSAMLAECPVAIAGDNVLNPHSPNNVLTFGVTCAIQI